MIIVTIITPDPPASPKILDLWLLLLLIYHIMTFII